MNRVSAAQRALVAKMATEQLMKKLGEAGVLKEEVDAMNREQRMEAWAGIIADGRDVPKTPAADASSSAMDLERERLAYAERRDAADRDERRADREAAARRDAADRAERQADREASARQAAADGD